MSPARSCRAPTGGGSRGELRRVPRPPTSQRVLNLPGISGLVVQVVRDSRPLADDEAFLPAPVRSDAEPLIVGGIAFLEPVGQRPAAVLADRFKIERAAEQFVAAECFADEDPVLLP